MSCFSIFPLLCFLEPSDYARCLPLLGRLEYLYRNFVLVMLSAQFTEFVRVEFIFQGAVGFGCDYSMQLNICSWPLFFASFLLCLFPFFYYSSYHFFYYLFLLFVFLFLIIITSAHAKKKSSSCSTQPHRQHYVSDLLSARPSHAISMCADRVCKESSIRTSKLLPG
jgi:hypothetical protein